MLHELEFRAMMGQDVEEAEAWREEGAATVIEGHSKLDLCAEAAHAGLEGEEASSDSEASTACCSSCGPSTPTGQQPSAAARARVRFRDEALAEVVEVESWKLHTRFTAQDKWRADRDWRSELLCQLQDSAMLRGALERLQGAVVELAAADEENGSLVVREALERAPLLQRVALIGELHGFVPGLLRSAHGGEVLKACLHHLPQACGFIAREISGHVLDCTRLRGGAGLLCELLRRLSGADVAPLKTEMLGCLGALCCHPQGEQVARSLAERSSGADRQQVVAALEEQGADLAELENLADR